MPGWTPRLVACAGLVALLGRVPAVGSVADAFLFGLVAACVGLAVAYGPAAARAARRLWAPSFPRPLAPIALRVHPAPGDDA
jgi:hypothetical protein